MCRLPQQRSGLDRRTISIEQQIAGINVASLLPQLIRDIPKLVILSRGDRGVANLELHQRAGMRPRGLTISNTRHIRSGRPKTTLLTAVEAAKQTPKCPV